MIRQTEKEKQGQPGRVCGAQGKKTLSGFHEESMAGAMLEELGIPRKLLSESSPDFASVAHANVENAMARGAVMIAGSGCQACKNNGESPGKRWQDYRKEKMDWYGEQTQTDKTPI